MERITLYRPVGPKELELIRESGWARFPPRLAEQPIFYPVANEEYARQIASGWNVRSDGAGFVLRFEVDAAIMSRYPVQQVGASVHREYWIPAEELDEFNDHIIGPITVTASFGETNARSCRPGTRDGEAADRCAPLACGARRVSCRKPLRWKSIRSTSVRATAS